MSEKKTCIYCQGKGERLYGHYDQGSCECRWCEGTGTQKWDRCNTCNKFGEVGDGLFAKAKRCPDCQGTRCLPMQKTPYYLDIEE